MIQLNNHRQLKLTETIRTGDFFKGVLGGIAPVKYSIGKTPNRYYGYTFWRRKHTKKPATVAPALRRAVAAQPAKAKYPTVTFKYKWLQREVQVIEMDDTYITGLEVSHVDGKNKYQFKKFLRRKAGPIELVKLADK